MKPKKVILITGVGGAAGIFLINHLRKNNFTVIAIDANEHSVGLLHADRGYVVPLCSAPNYIEVIQKICEKERVSFIIPLIDEELKLMKNLESGNLKVICPSEKFIEITLDKFLLTKELSKIETCIPETFLLSEDYSSLEFPVVVKPRTGRGSKDVFYANNNDELDKILSLKKESLKEFIVQEKICGEEYTVSVVVTPDNELKSIVPKKIIEKSGITKSALTEHNHKITTLCEKITKELKPSNPFNVQLILSRIDNTPYIFEINPRFSTTITLTIAAGVDEIMYPLNFYSNPNLKQNNDFISGLVLVRSTQEEYIPLDKYNLKKSKVLNLS
jgi:carbamoyl-phosphate synthase large subunit